MRLLPRRRAAQVRQRLQALALLIREPQPVYLAWHREHSLSSAIAAQAYRGWLAGVGNASPINHFKCDEVLVGRQHKKTPHHAKVVEACGCTSRL